MKTRITLGIIVIMFVISIPVAAGGEGEIQKYFNEAVVKVKATENAAVKREILNESFEKMFKAINKIQSLGLVSLEESKGIDLFKTSLREKQDELKGINGFERVQDSQLNDFSNYVVQDMEQAFITISLVSALLIIIILILIL
ncbi:MAG: hypothetical protein CVV24_11940 [Ignavibacteriae bacterium HGW-Ignavibacteriae-3]|nr:MAG: hypothetical protein CVV24_11940 [Ignavibacteriae bacterium HGW-Ignavibacteriae-3]